MVLIIGIAVIRMLLNANANCSTFFSLLVQLILML